MSLISSISGIRGTIGGKVSENLTPIDIVKFAAAYGMWIKHSYRNLSSSHVIIIGRDARPSGKMVFELVANTLIAMGFDILNLGITTTPTVEMAVPYYRALGGMIITASHNPIEWNALKLLNHKGEFISAEEGEKLLQFYQNNTAEFVSIENLGTICEEPNFLQVHIDSILELPYVKKEAIAKKSFKIAFDGINSSGEYAVPAILNALDIPNENIFKVQEKMDGWFTHNPEPLKQNLQDLCNLVKTQKCDLGIAVDPDVDRLVFVDEKGELFGEEYTLVAVADYILSQKLGPTVSNLSSSRALKDLTESYQQPYYAAAVGEVNVVQKMKEVNAVIGGEGNGGIILPELHYGRDALVGIALFLSFLAELNIKCSELRKKYTHYEMIKDKMELTPDTPLDNMLKSLAENYKNEKVTTIDGVKIDFEKGWVHLRKSNTEPIIRIYAEAQSEKEAQKLVNEVKQFLMKVV